jgi:23S rRNA (pseudouridine1915-N3)-methyltransferase
MELWLIGKNESYAAAAMALFEKRIGRYVQFETRIFEASRKGNTPALIRAAESLMISSKLEPRDYLIILDERGKEYSSEKFAALMESLLSSASRRVVFLIGGAYGVDDALRLKAKHVVSLSKMVFSHQVARLVFIEQLYRAFTIIHREPYHHS